MQKLKIFYGTDPLAEKFGGNAYAWPESKQKRMEFYDVKRNRPHEAQSVYMCQPGQRTGAIFMEDDFTYYRQPVGGRLEDGVADSIVRNFTDKAHEIVIAWDTASEDTKHSAYTAGVVAMLVPCTAYHRGEEELAQGECDPHMDVYVLDVFRSKIDYGDLVKAFRTFQTKWNPHLHIVERKQTGLSIIQSLSKVMNIEGVEAQESKRNRAIRNLGVGAASAQGWFRQHRVYFPSEEPDRGSSERRPISWMHAFRTELKDFTGDESATSDQVDALVHLLHFAIRESSNLSILPDSWTPETVEHEMWLDRQDNDEIGDGDPLNGFQLLGIDTHYADDDSPFSYTCGNCTFYNENVRSPKFPPQYCLKHKRTFISLDFCDDFNKRGT